MNWRDPIRAFWGATGHATHVLRRSVKWWPDQPDFRSLEVRVFAQLWPDTTFGFTASGKKGGVASLADTVVVGFDDKPYVAVYHGGRFAYAVKRPNAKFFSDMNKRRLLGAADYRREEYDSDV